MMLASSADEWSGATWALRFAIRVVLATEGANERTLIQAMFMLQQCGVWAEIPVPADEDALITKAMELLKQRSDKAPPVKSQQFRIHPEAMVELTRAKDKTSAKPNHQNQSSGYHKSPLRYKGQDRGYQRDNRDTHGRRDKSPRRSPARRSPSPPAGRRGRDSGQDRRAGAYAGTRHQRGRYAATGR
mmetsp:Transcript_16366/g.44460  ORF Transcript_16366/g.44460 Transcript_16366/m.44460 type:complete len:187 (-) Transcript_16366:526-1086(-)